MLWKIVTGQVQMKKGKKEFKLPTGVGSFLHLEGVPDKQLLRILNLVVSGDLATEKMIQLAKKIKGEIRCKTAALKFLQNLEGVRNCFDN